MQAGAITSYVDVAQLCWWAFFLAFIGIVIYLRRMDKTEGYPLIDEEGPRRLIGFPKPPTPTTYLRMDGSTTTAPHYDENPPMSARKSGAYPGAPLDPVGNKLTAAIGAGTYTMREDKPFLTTNNLPQVQPMRVLKEWSVMEGDADPRGMRVLDTRYLPVGVVTDIWVDRGTKSIRYLEAELDADLGSEPILLGFYHCSIHERKRDIRVMALHRPQFAFVPRTKHRDMITAREEDMINGFYAGGRFHIDEPVENTL